jgi:putative photosynthetic complex assembly protein 2
MSPGESPVVEGGMTSTSAPQEVWSHAGWLGGAPRIYERWAPTRATWFRTRVGVSLIPFAVVVAYWWLATGLIFAMQRDGVTRVVGAAISTVLGGFGAWMVWRSRSDATPVGARRGFLGAALIWGWVSVALYGGWIVGPAHTHIAVPAVSPSLESALRAAHTIAYHEVLALVLLVTTWWMTRTHVNRIGFWAYLTFWSVQATAKLNVFLGVENPGGRFLPESLWFLESYFGPPHHGIMLPVTLGLLLMVMLTGALVWVRHPAAWMRQAAALLTTLLGLALVEHLLLAISVDVPLWDLFLRSRGY